MQQKPRMCEVCSRFPVVPGDEACQECIDWLEGRGACPAAVVTKYQLSAAVMQHFTAAYASFVQAVALATQADALTGEDKMVIERMRSSFRYFLPKGAVA